MVEENHSRCGVSRCCVYLTRPKVFFFFFFNDTATTEIYTLSLHDALPICGGRAGDPLPGSHARAACHSLDARSVRRSEEHTSELQSQSNLVCRLLLEKKKKYKRLTYVWPH